MECLLQVVEKPRPAAAWNLVLQEMKWMAADIQQERLWKASAARCQAAAVRVAVEERQARRAQAEAEAQSRATQRRIATSLAEQVRQFWGHVNSLYEYEKIRRRTIFNTNLLSRQLNHMTAEHTTTTTTTLESSSTVARKRKADELEEEEEVRCPATPLAADPINNNSGSSSSGCGEGSGGLPPGLAEGGEAAPASNGILSSDDDESTIAEQEVHELVHCVGESELAELTADLATELSDLLGARYPGVLTEYADSADEVDDEDNSEAADSDLENSEPPLLQSLLEDKDRTEKSNNNGVLINRKDLSEISELAESILPKSVINCVNRSAAVAPPSLLLTAGRRLREYQLVALDWLQTMYREKLPAVLADEQGLGRRVVTAAFISNLVCEVGAPAPTSSSPPPPACTGGNKC